MIGVDTNVLVRILVRDDPKQQRIARQFMKQRTSEDPAFVSAVVLTEVTWVLERSYGFALAAIRDALGWVFESTNVVVEQHELLRATVDLAVEQNSDISDTIIAAIASDAGASRTVTFDQPAAKRIPGMELLK